MMKEMKVVNILKRKSKLEMIKKMNLIDKVTNIDGLSYIVIAPTLRNRILHTKH